MQSAVAELTVGGIPFGAVGPFTVGGTTDGAPQFNFVTVATPPVGKVVVYGTDSGVADRKSV